jgi:tetratricopeptide (TPR) repeat protein
MRPPFDRVPLAASVLLLVLAATAASGTERVPPRGLTPGPEIGGLISVPGSPLPPVPESSVRTAIALYGPIVKAVRLLGDGPAVARGLGYLATLHAGIREYAKAEELFGEAEHILEKNGSPPRDLAWVHNNRGLVLLRQERYGEGLRSFRVAVSLLAPERRELLEPRVVALQNLASAYSLVGDADDAENSYFAALDLLARLGQEGSHRYKLTRSNLALLYGTMGDFVAARKILDELADDRGLGAEVRFQVLNNLGYVLSALKEFSAAERRLNEARALTLDGTRARALVLTNLASMHVWAGDFVRAEEAGALALALTEKLDGKDSRSAAAAEAALAVAAMSRNELVKADRLLTHATAILSKGSGDEEAFAFALKTHALVVLLRGDRERATVLSRRALTLARKHLDRLLAFGSEAQRLAYRDQAAPYDELANLGDPVLLADAVLTMKGAVLDSLLAERALVRRSRSESGQERIERINALKFELMEKTGRGQQNLGAIERALKDEETALAKEVAPSLAAAQPPVDLARVQAVLENGQVLVELIRYQRYQRGGRIVWSYGGIVIPGHGQPRWVVLGDAEALDRIITGLRERLQNGGRGSTPDHAPPGAAPMLRELHACLWRPLEQVFPPRTRTILLSPDAATSFVPWGGLLDAQDRFLAERWPIVQIDSAQDLLRPAGASRGNTLLALGDAAENLPYSREEVEAVGATAEQHGWQATVLLGKEASEAELSNHRGPRILHLATHAGQLPRGDLKSVSERLHSNPMYRGYLVLGGGAETLRAWQHDSAVPFSSEGLLTAEEASGLDLVGTWLTVLSACETGAGDPRTGEGILGLRRGFKLAGTNQLMFSLWRVNDRSTASFMESFYSHLFESGDPACAFLKTQAAELRRWKDETHDPAAAVSLAGAFVLTR